MDRYQKVEKPIPVTPISDNEIRITTGWMIRNYVSYATSMLQEKGSDKISLMAMGKAISKTVIIAELIKRRIAGLHQNTSIGSKNITETWEPLEEGLLPLETTRHVSMIAITLSKKGLDTSCVGYQPPILANLVKPWDEYDYQGESDGSPDMYGSGGELGGPGRSRGTGFMREQEMVENEVKGVIEVIEISSSPENPGSPVKGVFCLKKKVNMREIEEREDCFILDFNPYDSLDLSKLSISNNLHNPDAPDISVIAEKGQIACRDYPHSRHLCLTNPFEKTPHETYCELCYCFVCDKAAPCKYWSGNTFHHCDAFDNEVWSGLRGVMRKLN